MTTPGGIRIGIMQGRLVEPEDGRFQSFPRASWRLEPERAARAGLDGIEWIYDAASADENPLATDEGLASMRELAARWGISIRSVCADYFMDRPLLRSTEDGRRSWSVTLSWLLERCSKAGIERIVLPFVDASRIETDEEHALVTDTLRPLLEVASRSGVELHLETALAPEPFARLLDSLPHPLLKVNYDTGNSASLGFRPEEELAAYGARVGSVHIKDRRLAGTTVPLGTGSTDFDAVFTALRDRAYRGDLILQAARGTPGDEVELARANRERTASWASRFLDDQETISR